MKISIITVTYNCADTLERTIKSVINQTYTDVEYIIIDGVSTDGTKEIIERYSEWLAYYCSEKDTGIYNAMNKGLSHVTGDVVLFLNGDDYLLNEHVLEVVDRRFSEYPEADIIIGKELIDGRVWDTYRPGIDRTIYVGVFFPHQATFAKKRVYCRIGFFDEVYRISADYDWVLRAYSSNVNIEWVDDIISVYSTGGRSASIDCVADEYLISIKYLKKTEQNQFLEYADMYYSNLFRKVYFLHMLNSLKSDKDIMNSLQKILPKDRRICIWGSGNNGLLLCKFLVNNNIRIECFYDSNSARFGQDIDGIPIRQYEECNDYIVISSEDYEDDIENALIESGLKKGIDYQKFSSISTQIVRQIIKNTEVYSEFYEKTGLDVLKFI